MNRLTISPPRTRIRQGLDLLALVFVAVATIWGSILLYKHESWKQFSPVVPGQVYRSGLLRSDQLEEAIDRLKLKTVICLADSEADREREICQRHGIRFVGFDMHSSGFGKPEDFREVVRLMADSASQPVLVHCRAGVARTGASVALYRMSVDGWDLERAINELKTFEKWGRCEPTLQAMIADYYRRDFVPELVRR